MLPDIIREFTIIHACVVKAPLLPETKLRRHETPVPYWRRFVIRWLLWRSWNFWRAKHDNIFWVYILLFIYIYNGRVTHWATYWGLLQLSLKCYLPQLAGSFLYAKRAPLYRPRYATTTTICPTNAPLFRRQPPKILLYEIYFISLVWCLPYLLNGNTSLSYKYLP